MVDATSTPPATTPITASQASSTIATSASSLNDNYNMFLNLLTAQLQNQDPLNPMDDNEFTQQLTQMTGVQQQLLTNQLLTQMLSQSQAQVGGEAVSLIGKQVSVNTPQTTLTNGQASWNYTLPTNASAVSLSVLDSTGKIVSTSTPTDFTAGSKTFSWNGKGLSGQQLPDGVYSLAVNATDANGNAITATETYSGVVTGTGTGSSGTTVNIGLVSAPVTNVLSVTQAAAS